MLVNGRRIEYSITCEEYPYGYIFYVVNPEFNDFPLPYKMTKLVTLETAHALTSFLEDSKELEKFDKGEFKMLKVKKAVEPTFTFTEKEAEEWLASIREN